MRGGGGERGGGGGFNPADMLSRFDRNNNKMIDPDEAEGPARFFLERLAQSNPKIDLSRPVPLETLTKEMDRMRGGGEQGPSAPAKPELLVPDFSLDSEPPAVEGFGSTSTMFNVKVEERDLKEAEERIRRYDRNGDGILSKEEIEGNRWSDDPMQYDRNGDGKISKSEMAVRYAKRRSDEQAQVNRTTMIAVVVDSCLAVAACKVASVACKVAATGPVRNPSLRKKKKNQRQPKIVLVKQSRIE